ncbi:uncharacterized protein CELE_Y53C12A.8 [Caenorhabditis elegans]|uniref:Expressed conserved protein n=1 Tax=Caenorhabditis elegans TaxID=6239 RepID=A0A7R9XMR8_CAEEL|nr:Expressed conserved protein [Caenorhabditis elegans]CAD8118723.1 Expressed conserved protein [Caenorhabditis elegans]
MSIINVSAMITGRIVPHAALIQQTRIFVLDSSETRSRAGSCQQESSLDGSAVSELHSADFDDLLESLERATKEVQESFYHNSQIFGQLMAVHGFQRATIDDDLDHLNLKTSSKTSKSSETFEPFDPSEMLLDRCHTEHAQLRSYYLQRLIDEDIMRSNVARIQELTEKFKNFETASSSDSEISEPTISLEEDLHKILDDVSTCQSFCPEDF